MIRTLTVPTLLLLGLPAVAQDSWRISAEKVYPVTSDAIEDGFVRVSDGKIDAVGSGSGSGGTALECYAVTPGLVDLSVRLNTGRTSVEESTETPITFAVDEGLDLFSYRWGRELRSGVTTALVTPYDNAVLGGFGLVLKTGGGDSVDERVVRRQAVLRSSLGTQPSAFNRPPRGVAPQNFYYRRPTTRMGVEWVFRKAFYDALATQRFPERATDETRVLLQAIEGELPVSIQTWATQDVRTAAYLKEEFGIPNMFLDAAAEAWTEPDIVARSGLGVVLPPFGFDGRRNDGAFMAWNSAAVLHEKGVTIALSGHGSSDVGLRLNHQPAFAMRGGLSFDAALAAVTINPARMVGVDDRVGSLENGKDADLVLWSGEPFEATSRVIGVILDGQLVVDPRAK
jgi:imidazolonepropionase-like amidohydrolase